MPSLKSLWLIIGFWMPVAQAWTLQANRLRVSDVELANPKLTHSADQVNLTLQSVQFIALDFKQEQLDLNCTWTRQADAVAVCAGAAAGIAPSWRGRFEWREQGGTINARLGVQSAELRWTSSETDSQTTRYRLQAQRLPLAWLQDRVVNLWSDLASLSGTLTADLSWTADSDHIRGDLTLAEAAFDSADGALAGAELLISGPTSLKFGAQREWQWQPRALRGQLLLGSVYFELPATDSVLVMNAATDASGRWQMPVFSWNDDAGLTLRAALYFDEHGALDIRLHELGAELEAAGQRYLASALGTAGFQGLLLRGRLEGSGRFHAGAWKDFDALLRNVSIDDPAGRIRVERLQGELRMGEIAAENRLEWTGVQVYAMSLGDGEAEWLWSPQRWQLKRPVELTAFGGRVRLDSLSRTRESGRALWLGGLGLQSIDLEALTRALDWPAMRGSVNSASSPFRFHDGGFSSEGRFEFDIFGGQMQLGTLSGERIFGVAPSVLGTIEFDNLDLDQLTRAFGFGAMQGWLDGRIDGLRMLDWQPVTFDAEIHTDQSFPGKQRISQRAVDGLSSVGGGGSSGGAFSRLVDTFSYARIGLRCRLAEDVCHMGGLEPQGTGYLVLQGAGLPRLTVIGHQKRVDWPVLLSRLKSASSGQAPQIE